MSARLALSPTTNSQIEVVKDHSGRGIVRLLAGSKRYYMRFRFYETKGWTPWRKTGTPELRQASKVASDEFQRLRERLSAGGGMLDASAFYADFTFIGTAYRWLSMYRRKAEMKQPASGTGKAASLTQYQTYKELVDRYMTEFFKRKNLDAITANDIYDYIEWRQAYFTTGPGSAIDTIETTRNGKPYRHKVKHEAVELRSGELATIKAIFEFASKEGLITAKQIPDIPRSSKNARDITRTRYPAFSKEHWKVVEGKLDAFTQAARNAEDRKARIGFKYFMLIMAETGLRSGKEHAAIKWRHVEFDKAETGEDIAYINVPEDTKTGSRLVIVGPHGTKIIKELKAWTAFSGDEDAIFAHQQTGKPIQRYSATFKKFINFAGLTKSKDDKPYAPYSLRHTYATRLRERGLPDHIIARLMGHKNTDMIAKHYGQDEITSHTEKIVATDKSRKSKTPVDFGAFEKGVLVDALISLPDIDNDALELEEDDGSELKITVRGTASTS